MNGIATQSGTSVAAQSEKRVRDDSEFEKDIELGSDKLRHGGPNIYLGENFKPRCTRWYGDPRAGAWPWSPARSSPRKCTPPAALSL